MTGVGIPLEAKARAVQNKLPLTPFVWQLVGKLPGKWVEQLER